MHRYVFTYVSKSVLSVFSQELNLVVGRCRYFWVFRTDQKKNSDNDVSCIQFTGYVLRAFFLKNIVSYLMLKVPFDKCFTLLKKYLDRVLHFIFIALQSVFGVVLNLYQNNMLRQRQDPEGMPLHLVTKQYHCLCYTFELFQIGRNGSHELKVMKIICFNTKLVLKFFKS